ncbi:hypothetical protein FE257_004910 [Aspergillus nanangensis]|uniref:DNA2/NAM7 helicase-like C-terminal domain-containing protein n=1 Tax=Aspergillus nanangensis TaxID=2582783 RepID=A0AAD4GN18_ASPNN|nr:hypothetical protein FE257_004910 [Aspergillus nanangensis]
MRDIYTSTFIQCRPRRAENTKCHPLRREVPIVRNHYCDRHLVGPKATVIYTPDNGGWVAIETDDGDDVNAAAEEREKRSRHDCWGQFHDGDIILVRDFQKEKDYTKACVRMSQPPKTNCLNPRSPLRKRLLRIPKPPSLLNRLQCPLSEAMRTNSVGLTAREPSGLNLPLIIINTLLTVSTSSLPSHIPEISITTPRKLNLGALARSSQDRGSTNILIMSPYKAQVALVKRIWEQKHPDIPASRVQTVDALQGSEVSSVIVLITRNFGAAGFLQSMKRTNVMLLRACIVQYVVGNWVWVRGKTFTQDSGKS